MKVALVIPLSGGFANNVPKQFRQSYDRAKEYLLTHLPEDSDFVFEEMSYDNVPTSETRNYSVGKIIEGGFDTSIWLDADQTLKDDTLYKLLIDGMDYPVYAGIYYLKKEPYHPIVFKTVDDKFEMFNPIWNYPLNELFYADMIGMGCVKIDTKVFTDLGPRWFSYGKIPQPLADRSEEMAFKRKYGVEDVSEDVHFWRRLRKETDYKVVIDPSIQVGHLVTFDVTPEYAIHRAKVNMLLSKKKDGKKFDEWWDENFPKAKTVNGKNKDIRWLFENGQTEEISQ